MNTRQEREHQIYTNFTGNSINNTAKSCPHSTKFRTLKYLQFFSSAKHTQTEHQKDQKTKKESPTNINMISNLNFKIKFKTPTKNQKKPPIFSNNKRTFFSYYAIQRPLINSI